MRHVFFASAAVALAVLGASPGRAADLGGPCCADLEERIAELEATTARKGNRKVSLTVYGQLNETIQYWDDGIESNAYVVENKTTRDIIGLKGSANIVANWSAGFVIELHRIFPATDNVNQFSDEIGTTGLLGAASQRRVGPDVLNSIDVRHSNWWIEAKQLGRVTLGMQSDATDGIAEIDLSGSTAAALSSVETWNESFMLRDKSTGAQIFPGFVPLGIYGEIFQGNFDGGRGNFIRYDSPVLSGFILSSAWGEDDDWDVALRHFSQNDTWEFGAGIGFRSGATFDTDNFGAGLFNGGPSVLVAPPPGARPDIEQDNIVGSASIRHKPSGLFLTVAAGQRDWEDNVQIDDFPNPVVQVDDSVVLNLSTSRYFYLKAGLYKQWISLGKTSLYGEYYQIDDVGYNATSNASGNTVQNRESAIVWGAGVVQHIDAAAMELYLAYRHYDAGTLNDPLAPAAFVPQGVLGYGSSAEVEMDMVLSGARIQF